MSYADFNCKSALDLQVFATSIQSDKKFKDWLSVVKFVLADSSRNQMLCDHALALALSGRRVIIPTPFVDHVNTMVSLINGSYGENIASGVVGRCFKSDTLCKLKRDLEEESVKIVVGTRMLSTLILPQIDTMLYMFPVAGDSIVRDMNLILYPYANKSPMFRYYVDEHIPFSVGCFRSSYRKLCDNADCTLSDATKNLVSRLFQAKSGAMSVFFKTPCKG